MTDQIMANDEIDEKNDSAERAFDEETIQQFCAYLRVKFTYTPDDDRRMVINMGPQHPSTHGVLRLSLEMEGESVLRSKPIIGYLHTGMEKTGEQLSYLQGPTNVTRMDYSSPLFSELAFSLATETLLEIEIPERATWIRMLMCELNRISSHLLFKPLTEWIWVQLVR